MTKEQKIQAYNRLQGTMAVVEDIARFYSLDPVIKDNLTQAYAILKTAQNNIGWDPGQK